MKFLKMFVLLGALSVPGWAQDSDDAPDHGVARISFLGGDVSVRRGDTGELVAAELNAPLVALDHVLTEGNSRAEIQLDWANFIRLGSESEVRLAELKDRDFLIQVSAGAVTFRVLPESQAQLEVSTPTLAMRPRQPGTYRITVRDDFSTELTVRSGEAEIFSGGRTDFARAGQTVWVSGDPANPQVAYRGASPRDEFDGWNDSRDQALDRSGGYTYVSRDIYGAEDLAGYGRWVYDAPYGWVWAPTVATSWAPYRVGRWTWVNYYGWTWISGDPWGWAPYHYGRWYHAPRYGWVWYPGEIHSRSYWRPALVGFFGWGTNVGWVALAPHEVYRPWYGPGRTVVTNVTYVHNIDVVQNYRNARFISGRSGVTSIVAGNFARKVTINNYVAAGENDLRRAGQADRWLPHEPSRENRQFSDRRAPHVETRRDVDPRFVSTRPVSNPRDRDDKVRRVDASPRNDRNDAGRGQSEGNRGRIENLSSPVAANRANNGRSENTRGPISVPRNDFGNRGRSEVPAPPVVANRPDNGRRNENAQRRDAVNFPNNNSGRVRQPEDNRARGNSVNSVASRPNETERRPAVVQRDGGTVGLPSRREPERSREAEISSGRAPAFARPEVEQPRPTPASATFRRAEPASRPDTAPAPQRAPEPQQHPGRFPGVEREQRREDSRTPSNPSPRTESRNSAPPSQASSPAPSASRQTGNSSDGSHNPSGHSRGHDRR